MAHELDRNADGTATMFSVRQTPWHQEGHVLDEAPDFKTALSLAGVDHEIELRPLITTFETDTGDTVEVELEGFRSVVRTDRLNAAGVLGVVGPSYHVLQNRHAFGVLEPLLDQGVVTLETGGNLRGGADPWMLAAFNLRDERVNEIFHRLGIKPYGLISNNHTGARKVTLKQTDIRVVCANTLGMALGRGATDTIEVRHTANVRENVLKAAEALFVDFTKGQQVIADQYAALKATAIAEAEFAKVVLDLIAPLPPKPEGVQTNNIATAAWEKATERAEEKRNRIIFLRNHGDGHEGDGSAWEAYNAVTQSIDHDRELWKVAGPSRAQALFDGNLRKLKQSALNAIFSHVAAGKAGKVKAAR